MMITTGIIEEIISKYEYRVRIPMYNKIKGALDATPTAQLYIANCVKTQGMSPAYLVGDVVVVTFQNNELESPIILGMLYCQDNDRSIGDLTLSSLDVKVDAKLPESTIIGNNVTGADIVSVVSRFRSGTDFNNIQNLIEIYASIINREYANENGVADYDLFPNE